MKKIIIAALAAATVAMGASNAGATDFSCTNGNCITATNSSTGSNPCVVFSSTVGRGVWGDSTHDVGVYGYSQFNNGIEGDSSSNSTSGVYGDNISGTGGYGIAGRISPAGPGVAVYGDNNTTNSQGWAGELLGKVYVATGIQVNTTCIAGSCTSDERLKKNINPLKGSLETISHLRPVSYEWKNADSLEQQPGVHVGFIAQDVEKVRPDWVKTGDDGFKRVNMDQLQPMMVDSLITLKTENDQLRKRVEVLEGGHRMSFGFEGIGLMVLAGGLVFFVTRRYSKN